MDPMKSQKSFKKLTLNKDTVQALPSIQQPAHEGTKPGPGAMNNSEYCSGQMACSWFLSCSGG